MISILFLTGLINLAIGQSACEQDNIPTLNEGEAEFLNNYFNETRELFDFRGKKIVFVSGSTGKTYITKHQYFEDIRKWNDANSKISTSLIVFTEKEKKESGGYDAIVTAWVKVLTRKRQASIVKELSSKAAAVINTNGASN